MVFFWRVEHYIEYTNLHIKLEVEGETQNMSWFRKAVMRITQSSPYKERHYVEISLAQDEADHLLKTIEVGDSSSDVQCTHLAMQLE